MHYPTDWNPELSKKPICGVLSTAMIAGVTFERATLAIKKNMMPFQKRHGGKTYHEQRCNALKELGVNFREIPVGARMTLQRAIAYYCRPGRTYMITTSSHVVTVKQRVKDGAWWVADQCQIELADLFNGRRCIVRHILEIL